MADDRRRRLAAILSADVAGYSRLMGDDEPATLDMLNVCRDVFRDHIARHDGRVVDTAGDSVLAVFDSVVEAVQCAIAVQTELENRNAGLAEARRMRFRIGVNSGDIIEQDDGTIYGDGVNVAARLQALAEPGGITVSEDAHRNVRNRLEAGFEDIGAHTVKNIPEPVRAYRLLSDGPSEPAAPAGASSGKRIGVIAAAGVVVLVIGGIAAWQVINAPAPPQMVTAAGIPTDDPVLAAPTGPAIAVLPFDNLSEEPGQAFFADGLTEEIITALSRFPSLRVIARNSTFQYKGQAVDVREVGAALGVRYVLEGSVRRAGESLRVSAQLLDARDGTHLWAETYDRDLSTADIFAVQDSIMERIVGVLGDEHGVISRAGLEESGARQTNNLAAYECVLRAYGYYDIVTPEEHFAVRGCLEEAVAADPSYAEAWGWLSHMYQDEFKFGYNPRPEAKDPLSRAIAASQNAIKADETSQVGYESLASSHYFADDLEQFRTATERAVALNPNNSRTLAWLGSLAAFSGDWARGIALTDKAVYLNPNHPTWIHATYAFQHFSQANYDDALLAAKRFNLPGFYRHHVYLAIIYGQLGRADEARAAVAKLIELYPDYADAARDDLTKWFKDPALFAAMLDGLDKAGLFDEPERPVIAVLPFTNMSDDPAQAYFSDGITEDIITQLTLFPDIAVIARNSTFVYKDQAVDVRQVGEELGARYVLEGSVRRAADQLRVTAQLTDAADGKHLWAEAYDRDLSAANIFDIQDQVTEQVTGALADMTGVIHMASLAQSKRKPPVNLTAYECVLVGYEFYRLLTPDLHQRARECLVRVVESESDYAEALAFAAFIEQEAYSLGYNPFPDSLERAANYAERAVAADSNNQNAQLSLARTYFFRHDGAGFAARAQQVLDLNPNNAQAVASVGFHLSYAGYWERGLPLLEKAMRLNPRYPFWYLSPFFHYHYLNRDFEKALDVAQQVQTLAPDYFENYGKLAAASGQLGRAQEAAEYGARILELSPEYLSFVRSFWQVWYHDPIHRELLADGLRKAGLDIPDETPINQ